MRCIVCHGDDIRVGDVREELRVEENIIYIPIQIPVCHTCGERYYDRRTIQHLEEVEQRLREGKANLKEVGKVLMLAHEAGANR
jgi:hypothetical protein